MLEKMLFKEFEEATSTTVVLQCPRQMTKCTLNLRNKKDATPAVMILNPLGDVKEPTQVGKGKSLQDQTTNSTHSDEFYHLECEGGQ